MGFAEQKFRQTIEMMSGWMWLFLIATAVVWGQRRGGEIVRKESKNALIQVRIEMRGRSAVSGIGCSGRTNKRHTLEKPGKCFLVIRGDILANKKTQDE